MSDTSTETVTLNLDGTFAAGAERAAAAGDKLDASLGKTAKTAKTAADALEQVRAKIAGFNAADFKALDDAEKKLKKMQDEALGIKPAAEKASTGFADWATKLGLAGVAVGAVKTAVTAVVDEMKRSREVMVGFIDDWGTAGGKLALFASAKRELETGVGNKLGGDFDLTRRNALKMGVDPDESWRISKKLLSDKFTQEEIPGILKIKAGMDLAGQNGEALITELQKLKLEPKIKSADIDRLYKMGIDSKAVYADLAKKLHTDVPTAMAKVKAGTVDTGEAIKSITKIAGDKFGGFTEILGNTIPSLLARVKGEAEDLFSSVDPAPVKKLLKDIIADIEGPQGARLKGSIERLFGAVFHTNIGGKLTVDKVFTAAATAADRATAAVKRLQPTIDRLLATLDRMQKTKGIDNLIKAGEGAAKEKIKEQEDVARAWATKGRLAAGKSTDIGGQFETVQKFRRKLREWGIDDAVRAVGVDTGESAADRIATNVDTDKVKAANKQGGKAAATQDFAETFSSPDAATPAADKLPLLLNAAGPAGGGGDQRAGAVDAAAEMGPGMAEGIQAGESDAIQAAADMAEKALQAAKDKLKIKSPSGAFDDEVGGQSAAGMAQGMTKHPGPEAAGKTMAANALGAAKGAAAGGASATAASGGSVTYQIHMGSGTTADDLARLEAMLRRVDRARAEGGSLPAFG